MSATLDPLILEMLAGPALPERSVKLDRTLMLGRSPECDWVLPDPAVSRRHALIDCRDGHWFVRDLGSRAGTSVNDHPLAADQVAPLAEHDRLRIGPWRFRLRRASQSTGRLASNTTQSQLLGSVTRVAAPMLAAERRLELLVEFAATTVAAESAAHIAQQLADFAFRGCGARVASVYREHSAEAEDCLLAASHPAEVEALPLPEALRGNEQSSSVIQAEIVLPGLEGARPLLAVVLRVDKEVRGHLLVELMRADPRQRADAAEYVHALARLASLTLGNVERRDIERRVERLHADLESAREVQKRVLPPSRGQCGGARYALHVHPGRLVAGDLADVFELPDGRTAVVLGDVSGAGFGAAFLMASVQAYLHAELLEARDVRIAAERCNAYISRIGGGRFVTAWIGIADPRSGSIAYVDAGHGLGRLIAPGEATRKLPGRGAIPIGIDLHAAFEVEHLELRPGERLVLFSDGVAEQRSPAGDPFAPSIDRTLPLCSTPDEDVDHLLSALELHAGGVAPADDATLLSLAFAR